MFPDELLETDKRPERASERSVQAEDDVSSNEWIDPLAHRPIDAFLFVRFFYIPPRRTCFYMRPTVSCLFYIQTTTSLLRERAHTHAHYFTYIKDRVSIFIVQTRCHTIDRLVAFIPLPLLSTCPAAVDRLYSFYEQMRAITNSN